MNSELATLNFTENNGSHTATLSFATADDATDTDGGSISVLLNADPAAQDTYTVSLQAGHSTATVSVIKVPQPVLTIVSTVTTILPRLKGRQC